MVEHQYASMVEYGGIVESAEDLHAAIMVDLSSLARFKKYRVVYYLGRQRNITFIYIYMYI